MRRNIIVIIAILLLVGWGIYDSIQNNAKKKEFKDGVNILENAELGIKRGNIAPDFELLNMNGEPVKLSDFIGKKVILNFWATWCPPCRVEMPHMEQFHSDYGNDVVILAVNLTHTETSVGKVADFVQDYGITFPVVLDEDGDISSLFRIVAYPTSYMINTIGIIHEVHPGAIDYDKLKQAVSRMD